MSTTALAGSKIALTAPGGTRAVSRPQPKRTIRRKISPQSGRALEMLGRAIEYLADEFALECLTGEVRISGEVRVSGGFHPRIAAMELLKACNREVYLECPEVLPLGERLYRWIRKPRRASPV